MSSPDFVIHLSSGGLRNIPKFLLPDDFTFYIGQKSYKCNKILASFISPIISQQFLSDPLFDNFSIDIPDSINDGKFEDLIDLMNGQSISLDENNIDYLMAVANLLKNEELYSLIYRIAPPLTIQNVISRVLNRFNLGLDIDDEANFIAKNLIEFDEKQLGTLGPTVLKEVFSSNELKIHSEDWLLNLISHLSFENDNEFKILYSCIKFNELSAEFMEYFLFNLKASDINEELWNSMKIGLLKLNSENSKRGPLDDTLEKSEKQFKANISTTIEPSTPENMNGIFEYLRQQFPNQSLSEIVHVSSSSYNIQNPPENVIDLPNEDSKFFESNSDANSWISFDFGSMRISASHYSLKTWFWGPGYQHLQSWVLEGSDDGREWAELDARDNDDSLNDALAFRRFKCVIKITCRFIRLRITGPDHSGTNILILNAIEFYGRLIA